MSEKTAIPMSLDEAPLTRAQAAKYLSLCTTSLDRLGIPHVRAGKRILYRREAIDKWLLKQEAANGRRR